MIVPRGLRNNNPGNLRPARIAWRGLARHQTDAGYLQFTAPIWGLRALARDLWVKFHKDGLHSIAAILEEYAPPEENDTWQYINDVCHQLGVGGTEILKLDGQLVSLMMAIVRHENKVPDQTWVDPYGEELYKLAVEMALETIEGQVKVGDAH